MAGQMRQSFFESYEPQALATVVNVAYPSLTLLARFAFQILSSLQDTDCLLKKRYCRRSLKSLGMKTEAIHATATHSFSGGTFTFGARGVAVGPRWRGSQARSAATR